jgi:hypothetical protein
MTYCRTAFLGFILAADEEDGGRNSPRKSLLGRPGFDGFGEQIVDFHTPLVTAAPGLGMVAAQ